MKFVSQSFLCLSLCGILLSTAACHRVDDKLTPEQVNTLKTSATSAKADATDVKNENNTKNMSSMLKVLSQADNIFNQVWPYVWEEGASKVNNIFSVSKQILKIRFNDDGKVLGYNTGCKGYDVSIRITKMIGNIPAGYALGFKSCQSKIVSNLLIWDIDPSGKMTMQFESANYPQGTGLSLKTLGRPVKCVAQIQPTDSRLETLKCEGLGQNNSEQQFVEFKTLEFSRESKMMVHIVGDRYKNLHDIERKIDLVVPLSGEIMIVEHVIEAPKPVEVAPVVIPKVTSQNETPDPRGIAKARTAAVPSQNVQLGAQPDEREYSAEEIELLKQGIPVDPEADQQMNSDGTPVQDRQVQEEPVDPALLN